MTHDGAMQTVVAVHGAEEALVVESTQDVASICAEIDGVFGAGSWAALSARWLRAWGHGSADRIRAEVLACRRGPRLVGFALVYRAPRLEVLRYLGGGALSFNRWLRRVWRDPLTLHVAYVDLPSTDQEAVHVHPDEPEPERVIEAMLRAAIADRAAHAVCVRVEDGSATAAMADAIGLGRIPMPPGTRLALDGGFEAWRATRSANRREHLRKDRRTLERAGGELRRITDPAPYAAALAERVSETVASNLARGGAEMPFDMRPAFYEALAEIPAAHRTVVAALRDGQIVGALQTLVAPGDRLLVGPCGLDYERSRDVRAYFCLWPEVIALAAEHGCREVLLGSTAYLFKERLGAVRVATSFRVAYPSRVLRAIGGPLTRALADAFDAPAPERTEDP
jgi:hypothetical protein